ncbi:potassium/proton antiporter, partial [Clostridium perfringens]
KLKNIIDTLVEFESGSNYPTAYMLTSFMLIFITSNESLGIGLLGMIYKQIVFGVTLGLLLSKLAVFILRKVEFEIEG